MTAQFSDLKPKDIFKLLKVAHLTPESQAWIAEHFDSLIPEEILLVLDHYDYSKETLAYIHSNLDQLSRNELVKLYTHPRMTHCSDVKINLKIQESLPNLDAYSLSLHFQKLKTDELSPAELKQHVLKALR